MQITVQIQADAARYAAEELQRTMRAPQSCPNCGNARSLEALGYYERWVSDERGNAVRISVRRFFVGAAK